MVLMEDSLQVFQTSLFPGERVGFTHLNLVSSWKALEKQHHECVKDPLVTDSVMGTKKEKPHRFDAIEEKMCRVKETNSPARCVGGI